MASAVKTATQAPALFRTRRARRDAMRVPSAMACSESIGYCEAMRMLWASEPVARCRSATMSEIESSWSWELPSSAPGAAGTSVG